MTVKINRDIKQVLQFLLFLILVNVFLLNLDLFKIYAETFSVQEAVGNWKSVQYFFTYSDEFVKRGLIGTVYDFSGVPVSFLSIFIFSIFASNLFFIMFYIFSTTSFPKESTKLFFLFMVLFVMSPATAMNLGFDLGRFDHINLSLMLFAIVLISKPSTRFNIILVLALIAIGILIHEAFVFICVPLVLAVSLNEIKKNNQPVGLLFAEVIVVISILTALFLFGKADTFTLDKVRYSMGLLVPNYDPASALVVWTVSLNDNIAVTMSRMLTMILHFIIVLPLLLFYIYLSAKILNFRTLCFMDKIVFIAPFGMLPLFLLGVDFFRWFALIITLMFVVFAYLVREKRLALMSYSITKKEEYVTFFILCYTIAGPLGIAIAFPYFTL